MCIVALHAGSGASSCWLASRVASPPRRLPTPPPTATFAGIVGRRDGIPDYGTTTNTHGRITNGAARQAFLAAYRQGQPGRREAIVSTIEGAWLQEDGVTLGELAARLGYESEAAFSRAFKRVMGVSPGAARRQPLPPQPDA